MTTWWEYKLLAMDGDNLPISSLEHWGTQGWEACGMNAKYVLLKKPRHGERLSVDDIDQVAAP